MIQIHYYYFFFVILFFYLLLLLTSPQKPAGIISLGMCVVGILYLSATNLPYTTRSVNLIFLAHLWLYASASLVVMVIRSFCKDFFYWLTALFYTTIDFWLLWTGQWGLQPVNNYFRLGSSFHRGQHYVAVIIVLEGSFVAIFIFKLTFHIGSVFESACFHTFT